MGKAVVSGDQRVLLNLEKSTATLKAFLFLTPLATHVWLQLAVSRFVLNGFRGQNQFSTGRKEGCEGPSLTSPSP